MASNINPSIWASLKLFLTNKQFDNQMQYFLNQLSQFAVQTQQQVTNLSSASGLTSIINSSGLLKGNSLSVVAVSSTITTNQTVNANNAAIIFLNYAWTAAANPTITINNLGNAIVFSRFANTSGAARTYTLSANTPAPVAYSVIQFDTGVANNYSTGVNLNNNLNAVIMGVASVSTALLYGSGSLN
jgi:hypothetical protein